MIEEQVVLVDLQGQVQGWQGKMQAHREGALHLAFSVLLYRETAQGREFLMHQRAMGKYHSGGLWTNTCCSHPRPSETIEQAGLRRLAEEMGITGMTRLHDIASFVYRAELDNQLTEYELDHVLVANMQEATGIQTIDITPDPNEVMAYRWWSQIELEQALATDPQQFTAWFAQVLKYAIDY